MHCMQCSSVCLQAATGAASGMSDAVKAATGTAVGSAGERMQLLAGWAFCDNSWHKAQPAFDTNAAFIES